MRDRIRPDIRQTVVSLIAVAGIFLTLQTARAESPAEGQASMTLVVFADRPMEGRQWAFLSDELRRAAKAETIIDNRNTLEVLRGDAIRPGIRVEDMLVVYLHGDCRLELLPRGKAYGFTLGWVRRENGHIAPFIHVDCSRITQVLEAQARGLNTEERNRMMAKAVAQVVLHEWIHVARQSAEHGRVGVTKANFGAADLLGDPDSQSARR